MDGLTAVMQQEIEALRSAAFPDAGMTSRSPTLSAPAVPRTIGPTRVLECPAGVERDIKRVEGGLNLHWANRDAENLAMLYRYHVKPGTPPAPRWQKRPGVPDKR